jgi:hypothetical protein
MLIAVSCVCSCTEDDVYKNTQYHIEKRLKQFRKQLINEHLILQNKLQRLPVQLLLRKDFVEEKVIYYLRLKKSYEQQKNAFQNIVKQYILFLIRDGELDNNALRVLLGMFDKYLSAKL